MLRVLFFLTIIIPILINGQLTLSNGHHVLEITGSATTYYNNRFLKSTQTDHKKNRFKLRDAQIQLEGRIGDDYEYELQFDLVDLATSS